MQLHVTLGTTYILPGVVVTLELTLTGRQSGAIVFYGCTPMQSAGHMVDAGGRLQAVITPSFGDIDFARYRPWTIGAILGHHPQGGPLPVAASKFGHDLNSSVCDTLLAPGGDSCRANRIDDCAGSLVASGSAGFVHVGTGVSNRGSTSIRGEIQGRAVEHLVGCEVCSVQGQGRDNVKSIAVDECVCWIGSGPVKGACAEASSLNLVAPVFRVERLEIVVHDKAIIVSGHILVCEID